MGRGDRVIRSRLAAGAVSLALVGLGSGCHKERESVSEAPAPPPAIASAEPQPTDHLASDELIEGEKKAFGVALPRVLHVDGAFVDVVFTSAPSGQVGVHPLAKYFRTRLTEGSLREGDEAATFEHVHVPGKGDMELDVRIRTAGAYTRVEFRDTTPRPQPKLPDDAARWRQAGLTPNGRLLDPTHLE